MKKTYSLLNPEIPGLGATINVNWGKLTPEICHEINSFLTGGERRLKKHNNDVQQVVLYMAANYVLNEAQICRGVPCLVQSRFEEEEGWPPGEELGIEVLELYVPETDSDDILIEEV